MTANEVDWSSVATPEVVAKTIAALAENGIEAVLAESREDVKAKALALVPRGAEIMTMTSVTLHELGIDQELNDSGNYNPVRAKLYAMDRATEDMAMRKLGAAPEYVMGSVHGVTEQGQIIIASNTGSQLPAEVYGSAHVIFVVGIQKIVHTLDAGMRRLYDYSLPLESERARKAYGVSGSFVSKVLIINKEVQPGRVHLIFVPESIGF